MKIKNIIKNPSAYFYALKKYIILFFYKYYYKGAVVLCENCNWKGRQFYNGKCPKCKSLARTRLIPFSLAYFKLVKREQKVLHVAPNLSEYNSVVSKLKNVKQYDRLDIRPITHINIVADLKATGLKENTYDLSVIWHVFEHIVEDTKAIYEVYRLLKPGGKLLMSVPIYPVNSPKTFEDDTILYKDYEKIHGHDDHCRSCGLDYYKRFEAVGFTTETLEVKNLDPLVIKKYGLSTGHVVWCFTK
ncbi:class I SAM-dependent methyltransferase [Lacinutrix undariae]